MLPVAGIPTAGRAYPQTIHSSCLEPFSVAVASLSITQALIVLVGILNLEFSDVILYVLVINEVSTYSNSGNEYDCTDKAT